MIMVLMKVTMVSQVYRSVLISGRRRRHSGNSENTHRQSSPTEGAQEQGNTRFIELSTLLCDSLLSYFGRTVIYMPTKLHDVAACLHCAKTMQTVQIS